MYSEKDRKMLWTIPFVLAILCGVVNPYGGLVGVISLVFGFLLVYFLQKNICKNACMAVYSVKTEKPKGIYKYETC